MIGTVLEAGGAFIGTGIDDIFLLTLLCTQAGRWGAARVLAGQYAGLGLLCGVSVLGALGTRLFPERYLCLLGLVPLYLAARAWAAYRRAGQDDDAPPPAQAGFWNVFLLTVANGADNVGVYIPLFSGYTAAQLLLALAVFACLAALWCHLALTLAARPRIRAVLERWQPVLVPAVLALLGLSILARGWV